MTLSAPLNRRAPALLLTALLAVALAGCAKKESAATLIAQAHQFEQKGEVKAAIIQLKNAIAQEPENAEARLLLGTLYNRSGDGASAEKEVRKAQSLKANPDATALQLATALLVQGQAQKVLDETEDGDKRGNVDLLLVRGNAFLTLHQTERARDAFERSLRAREFTPLAMVGMARVALQEKKVDEAARIADDATTRNPASIDAWMFKGELAQSVGKAEAALAAFDQVLKLDAHHHAARVARAHVEINSKKYDAAGADLDAADKDRANALDTTYARAVLAYQQENYKAARDALQKILKVASENAPTLLLAGATELHLGEYQLAQQHLAKYVEKNADQEYGRTLLASSYLKLGRGSEAIATLSPLLAAKTVSPGVLALAGEAYMQLQQYDKAGEMLQRASTLAPQVAAVRTTLAMSKLARGDTTSAIGDLEASTKLDSKNSKAGTLLVLTEMRLKHFDKALAAADALIAAQPKDAGNYNVKGGVQMAMKDSAHARASFEQALALQPDFFPATGNLAQMAMVDNKPDEAHRLLTAFAEKYKSVDAMRMLARVAAASGNHAESGQWLERASRENPDALQPALELGNHYLRSGQAAKALTVARQLVVAHPDQPEALDLLGQAQLAGNQPLDAIETYSKLAAAQPKAALGQVRLASAYLAAKNESSATTALKKAIALAPENEQAKLILADLLARSGKRDEALAMARQIEQQHPKAAGGFQLEGRILNAQGKPEQAVRAMEQALARADSADLAIELHRTMRQAGKAKEADARLAKWQQSHPADLASEIYLAEGDLGAKDYKGAIARLEKVLAKAPANIAALNNLAWAYQQLGDARALKTAELAYKAAPDNAAVIDTFGWLLVEQGDKARGVGLLQQAVDKAPQAPDLRYHLAVGLAKTGETAKARTALQDLLKATPNFAQAEQARTLLASLH